MTTNREAAYLQIIDAVLEMLDGMASSTPTGMSVQQNARTNLVYGKLADSIRVRLRDLSSEGGTVDHHKGFPPSDFVYGVMRARSNQIKRGDLDGPVDVDNPESVAKALGASSYKRIR